MGSCRRCSCRVGFRCFRNRAKMRARCRRSARALLRSRSRWNMPRKWGAGRARLRGEAASSSEPRRLRRWWARRWVWRFRIRRWLRRASRSGSMLRAARLGRFSDFTIWGLELRIFCPNQPFAMPWWCMRLLVDPPIFCCIYRRSLFPQSCAGLRLRSGRRSIARCRAWLMRFPTGPVTSRQYRYLWPAECRKSCSTCAARGCWIPRCGPLPERRSTPLSTGGRRANAARPCGNFSGAPR